MNKNISRVFIVAIVVLLVTALFFALRTRGPVKADSGVHLVMGTFARVTVLAPDSRTGAKCIEAALAEIRKVDELMSDYKEDSEISRVNKGAFARPVEVGESTFEVIRRSIEFSRLTDGAFDITVGPLVQLFRKAKDKGIAPTPEQIADAKARVGYEKLILNDADHTVRFTVEGMSLDVGGIGKGYAVDKAIEAVQKLGAPGAMVDLGGHVRCFGTPPKGREKWIIGLQDPNIDDFGGSGILLKLQVSDTAVITSGDYQQFAIINGKKQSHIIDRRTGKGAEGLSSVTIIAPNATDGDALATAVSVMGPEKGLGLIEKLPQTEAILISPAPEYNITKTTGAEKFIKK
jgi:thiamine biosynthesis lipoprotein